MDEPYLNGSVGLILGKDSAMRISMVSMVSIPLDLFTRSIVMLGKPCNLDLESGVVRLESQRVYLYSLVLTNLMMC